MPVQYIIPEKRDFGYWRANYKNGGGSSLWRSLRHFCNLCPGEESFPRLSSVATSSGWAPPRLTGAVYLFNILFRPSQNIRRRSCGMGPSPFLTCPAGHGSGVQVLTKVKQFTFFPSTKIKIGGETSQKEDSPPILILCPGEDLNLHVLLHTHLKRTRLPISPPGRVMYMGYVSPFAKSYGGTSKEKEQITPFFRNLAVSPPCKAVSPPSSSSFHHILIPYTYYNTTKFHEIIPPPRYFFFPNHVPPYFLLKSSIIFNPFLSRRSGSVCFLETSPDFVSV